MPPTPRVEIQFGARTEEFGRGVRDVSSQLNDLGSLLQRTPLGRIGELIANPLVGAASAVAAIVSGIREAVNHAERIQNLAAQIGGTTGQAQAVMRAEARAGVASGTVQRAVDKLQEQLGAAQTGGKSAMGALEVFGMSPEAAAGMAPLQVLERVISRFKDGTYSAREYAAANQLLGRSFDDLIPAVRRGFLQEMGTQRASDLSPQDIAAAGAAGEANRGFWGGVWDWTKKASITGLRTAQYASRRGQMFMNVMGGAIGGPANWETAMERVAELQAMDYTDWGTYESGDLSSMEGKLRASQQRRALLESLRSANRAGFGELQFSTMKPEQQLTNLLSLRSQAASGLTNESTFAQERAAASVLSLQKEITKLEGQIRELNEKAGRVLVNGVPVSGFD